MKDNNGLNVYSDNLIPLKHRNIIKYAIFLSAFLIILFAILTIVYINFYKLSIGLLLGSVGSILLFYKTHQIVEATHYTQYKKMIKKIHVFYQVTYIVLYFALALFLKSILAIVGLTIGLLIIKISSLLVKLFNKKD